MYCRVILIFVLQLSGIVHTLAQSGISTGTIGQVVSLAGHQKKELHYEAYMKCIPGDSNSKVCLFLSFLDKKGKTISLFKEIRPDPATRNWTRHSIVSTIPGKAVSVVAGSTHTNKSVYYYDAFLMKTFTKGKTDSSQNLILNPSFEADSLEQYWTILHQPSLWFTDNTSSSEAWHGKQSLEADGRTFRKLLIYGRNESAGHYITANNVRFYAETYGEGPDLILLHGNGQHIGVFSQQIYTYSKYFRVTALDTRGHGKSGDDGKTYTYDLFAEDVNAIMDSSGMKKAIIVGWSDGGNTGLILAMNHPEKVQALITMGANIFINDQVVSKKTLTELERGIKQLRKDTGTLAKQNVRLLTLLLTEPRHRFEELSRISCPVLVVAGEKDIIKETHTKAIAAAIPKSTLQIVPGATHDLPRENARLFNKIVLLFLGISIIP